VHPILKDVRRFTHRLTIQDRQGRVVPFSKKMPEQMEFMRYWQRHKNILVLKPRQVGMTTISQACAFHAAYTARDPINILTLAHESGACGRVNRMLRQYWRGLPKALRPRLTIDNSNKLQFRHNGATLQQYMAGGRGQGRSETYHMAIFTEMAFYPQGSASVNGGTEADRDAWASVMATMHDGPYKRVVVESTGNGPTGQFYDLVDVARRSQEWGFLFYRWFDFAQYQITPPEGWERTDEEAELAALYGVSDRQLAWRRKKMVDEGISSMRFRREYPSTWEDPFLLAESTWFDADLLNKTLGKLKRKHADGAMSRYLGYNPERKYYIGMDTSGGTGRDYSVIVVMRDDFEIAAVWRSNTTPPHEQARMGAKLSAEYGGATVLCEENNYGRDVINRMSKLGARCWKDEKGKNFWTQGGRAGQTKKMVYNFARHMVNDAIACSAAPDTRPILNDPEIIRELIIVREDARGNIQAPEGKHDDHADAFVLALWCARRSYIRSTIATTQHGRAKLARARGMRI
jgi:hypothetical protein